MLLSLTGLCYAAAALQQRDIKVGDGDTAVRFSKVSVHYSGWLENGTKFDSSLDRSQPFEFTIGAGQVISGWEQGVVGMRVGGKRELIIPPELGYGKRGAAGVIPADATLRFEIELLGVTPPAFHSINNPETEDYLSKGIKIIDIRLPEEWKQTGVIKESIRLTAFNARGQLIPTFADELAKLVSKDEPFMIICRTGNRTSVLAQALSERLGYKNVLNVEKGITHWIKEGLPVSKD
ncbi:MAG: FKBP-type peptidyl-prolyl cis-trans isomerase [Gammaproteobacteria bacterium]|nr:FKBP-type peptidyl-prolyl cis-trans isomerase [Gammaproteobacteria bacterium]